MIVIINFIDEPIFKFSLMEHRVDGFYYRSEFQPGTAKWVDTEHGVQLSYVCPCGCGAANIIPVNINGGYGWRWNGSRDKPTLVPSIAQTTSCKWHGFLTDGIWTS